MKKEDLRKVYYSRWDSVDVDHQGYFHGIGQFYSSDKEGIITKAIVENALTGLVEKTEVDLLKFVDKWE